MVHDIPITGSLALSFASICVYLFLHASVPPWSCVSWRAQHHVCLCAAHICHTVPTHKYATEVNAYTPAYCCMLCVGLSLLWNHAGELPWGVAVGLPMLAVLVACAGPMMTADR